MSLLVTAGEPCSLTHRNQSRDTPLPTNPDGPQDPLLPHNFTLSHIHGVSPCLSLPHLWFLPLSLSYTLKGTHGFDKLFVVTRPVCQLAVIIWSDWCGLKERLIYTNHKQQTHLKPQRPLGFQLVSKVEGPNPVLSIWCTQTHFLWTSEREKNLRALLLVLSYWNTFWPAETQFKPQWYGNIMF